MSRLLLGFNFVTFVTYFGAGNFFVRFGFIPAFNFDGSPFFAIGFFFIKPLFFIGFRGFLPTFLTGLLGVFFGILLEAAFLLSAMIDIMVLVFRGSLLLLSDAATNYLPSSMVFWIELLLVKVFFLFFAIFFAIKINGFLV